MPLRLVLADDAALIRQALAELLQQAGVEVVAQAGNAPSLVRAVENNRPDVAIIDIRMPRPRPGKAFTQRLRSASFSQPSGSCFCQPTPR